MNQIDQLISQAGIQGTFDVRCLYRGGFRLPHEQSPAGVMLFHLLMKGEIRVSTAQGDDVVLRPGDLLLLPGGEPHTIWREGDTLALAEPGDGLLPLRGDGGDQVEFLCGEYRYQGPLRPLLLDALPSPLCIPLLASESQQALSLVLSLIHQELQRDQQGSGAVLTALSQVLLAMGLRAHASDPHGALGLIGALQDPRLGRSLQAMLADPAHPGAWMNWRRWPPCPAPPIFATFANGWAAASGSSWCGCGWCGRPSCCATQIPPSARWRSGSAISRRPPCQGIQAVERDGAWPLSPAGLAGPARLTGQNKNPVAGNGVLLALGAT